MNISKRTTPTLFRACPEFLELVEVMRQQHGGTDSVADILHMAMADYARKYYWRGNDMQRVFDLCDIVGDTDTNKRRKQVERLKKNK